MRPRIASAGALYGRDVIEWIGATPNSVPPDEVKRRVLLRYNRTCHWTGVPIRPGDEWDTDHVIALINGGQNRESNLAPIRRGKAHKEKTRVDMEEADYVKRVQKRHYGLKKPSRGFNKWKPNAAREAE